MPDTDVELSETKVKFRKDGTLVQSHDGKDVVIATYDQKTGHLQFETVEYSQKLYNQVTARIGTVKNGEQESGFKIKSITVKGQSTTESPKTKRPKMGPEGDVTPEVVDWYVKNALSEAIIRYGIYTDKNGQPIRKDVRRIIEETVDDREMDDNDLAWKKTGNKTQEKSPVARARSVIELKKQIIARRASRYREDDDGNRLVALFTPQEVVGGLAMDDEGNPEGEE